MAGSSNLVQLRTVRNQAIVAGGVRVIPESQVLEVRLPFGGLVWHRPTAVVVEQQGGRASQRMPIFDMTRAAQAIVLLGTLLITVVCLIASSRQQES